MVYGSFYNFSLGNFFSGINGNFLFWALIFLGLFLLGNFVLKKVFVNNPRIGTVIALIFTTLAVYWMSKKYYLNVEFLNLGLIIGNYSKFYPWIILAIALIIVWKWDFARLFMIFGGLIDLFALLPGLVYETGIALVIGTFLFLIGFVWYIKKKGKIPKIPRGKGKTSKGDQTLEIFIYPRGSGKTKPHAGTYTYRTGKRVKVRIKEGNWDHWLVNGVKYSKRILKLKMKMNYKVVAVFGASSSSGGGGSGGGKPRLDILKAQAKAFKQWTLTQKNPKFYQSWAYFLSWMKKKGYGGSEAEIMKNLYVTKRDIVHAVRKYIK